MPPSALKLNIRRDLLDLCHVLRALLIPNFGVPYLNAVAYSDYQRLFFEMRFCAMVGGEGYSALLVWDDASLRAARDTLGIGAGRTLAENTEILKVSVPLLERLDDDAVGAAGRSADDEFRAELAAEFCRDKHSVFLVERMDKKSAEFSFFHALAPLLCEFGCSRPPLEWFLPPICTTIIKQKNRLCNSFRRFFAL